MKAVLATSILALAALTAYAFSPGERTTMLCSIPKEYMTRWIDCTLEGSPKSITQVTDIVHECVSEYREVSGVGDSIRTAICDETIEEDENIEECLQEKVTRLPPTGPTPEDRESLKEAVSECLFGAK